MKLLKLKQIGFLLVMLMGMMSCVEESEPSPTIYTYYGFIYNDGGYYYVDIDTGEKLKVVEFDDSELDLEPYDRVIVSFIIEETPEVPILYDHLVELQGFYDVDFSDIVTLDETSRDTIGDGFITLTDYHIAGDYLNIQVYYDQQDGEHIFSLCYDETQQEEGEPVILDLRNYYPESADVSAQYYTYKSYNLMDLSSIGELNDENKIEFILRTNKGDSQEQKIDLVYNPM
ncbi:MULTISPECIES: NigD1/NigD2 family lipoprotein [unclassified Saccharicrinis]|uniref:NigD1/NigD2 family lipoprotein n=1 Tax=unclassified Saccharicrinis TaxID=2646859 RepID=UPI003D326133